MQVAEVLEKDRTAIVDAAEAALSRMQLRHYENVAEAEVRHRLEVLYDHLVDAIERRDLVPMIEYVQDLAEERFGSGYGLYEVQVAFNVLEESTWARLVADVEPSELAEALGLVGTVLGCGKDALACRYVSLAARTHTPSLDLRKLFTGIESP